MKKYMIFSVGQLDVWVLIPTVSLDFRFKGIGFTWLKWTCDISLEKEDDV